MSVRSLSWHSQTFRPTSGDRRPCSSNHGSLANAIETAFTFGRSQVIRLQDLPASISGSRVPDPAPTERRNPVRTFADAERDLIHGALEATEGNKVHAAKLLKISRKKLYAKIAKYGL
jgi:DNA-binding NtrC family response regulator